MYIKKTYYNSKLLSKNQGLKLEKKSYQNFFCDTYLECYPKDWF